MPKCQKTPQPCNPENKDCPDARLITPLIQLLFSTGETEFKSPLTNVVHCLITLPLDGSQSDLFPKTSATKVVQHIIDTLDRSVPQDTESVSDTTLDETLAPVISLLSSLYEIASEPLKSFMRHNLLPTDEYALFANITDSNRDRIVPLGQTQSLPSRLLRLVTNAYTPTLREAIFSLIFQLVDSSPAALVDAIGYGYASGYLFSHNIPIPANLQNPGGRGDVNPVTGQRLDAESIPDFTEMTDEEKEREAERLFVLFERMRTLGVGVENPVRVAQQSGQLEELD